VTSLVRGCTGFHQKSLRSNSFASSCTQCTSRAPVRVAQPSCTRPYSLVAAADWFERVQRVSKRRKPYRYSRNQLRVSGVIQKCSPLGVKFTLSQSPASACDCPNRCGVCPEASCCAEDHDWGAYGWYVRSAGRSLGQALRPLRRSTSAVQCRAVSDLLVRRCIAGGRTCRWACF